MRSQNDRFHFDGSLCNVDERFAVTNAHGSVPSCRAQKRLEVPFDRGREVERFLDGVVSCSAESLQQRVRRQRAGVPMAALDLVKWIPHPPVVAIAGRTDDLSGLVYVSEHRQVRRHLVFDPGPHLETIWER